MGGRPPAPRVEYIPAPPPPVTVSTPTQSLKTQVELTRILEPLVLKLDVPGKRKVLRQDLQERPKVLKIV
jgi:hypothetical protein